MRVGSPAPPAFHQLIEKYDLHEKHLMHIAMIFLRKDITMLEEERYWGRKLMDMLSAAGYQEATIRIVHNYLVQSQQKSGVLKNATAAIERGRLEKIANQAENSRAMVLMGKVAYALGDRDAAIKWWWRAVDEAVTKGNDWLNRRRNRQKEPPEGFDYGRDLTTPWIELIEAHFDRSGDPQRTGPQRQVDLERCEQAIKIGVDQDDPTAFYYSATFYKKYHENGTHMPTSDWLYDMTKAAASGVPKAAYELAQFYTYAGWKYIEDEPPDHLKPTPFDTVPPDTPNEPGFWDHLRQFLNPSSAPNNISGKEYIFQSAAWPPTPKDRYKLAHMWTNIAIAYTYVPACILKAKLYYMSNLWAGAEAPKEALELHPSRYLYANKREEADAHFTGELKTRPLPDDDQGPENPTKDEERAKQWLLEVLYAHRAIELRDKAFRTYARQHRTSNVSWDDVDLQPELRDENAPAAMYLHNKDVLEMWQADIHRLAQEVKDICDQKGWDLRNAEGALWYKCSSSPLADEPRQQSAVG